MLNNVTIGKYINVDSVFHDMNPLAKIICIFILTIMTFLTNVVEINMILFLFALILALLTNIPIRNFIKPISSLKTLIIFIIIINLIFKVYWIATLLIVIKLVTVVLYSTLLTLTTTTNDLVDGFEKFLAPLKLIKVPVNRIALSLSLSLKFIPILNNEANKIIKSQASRGIDFYNSNIKEKLIAIKSIVFPMFNLSIKKADTLAEVMEIRNYNINNKRVKFREHKWGLGETYMVLIHISLLVVIIAKEVIR